MSTFDYYFDQFLTASYQVPIADVSSNYTAIMKTGDTINVNVVFNNPVATQTEIVYLLNPAGDATRNDPDLTLSSGSGFNKTFSLVAPESTERSAHDPYAHWHFFVQRDYHPIASADQRNFSLRALILPRDFGFLTEGDVVQGSSINVPISTAGIGDYFNTSAPITGTPSVASGGEKFSWKLVNATGSDSDIVDSTYFTNVSGTLFVTGSSDNITIAPTTTCPDGTYFLRLYHYNTTPQYVNGTASSSTTGGAATFVSETRINVGLQAEEIIEASDDIDTDDTNTIFLTQDSFVNQFHLVYTTDTLRIKVVTEDTINVTTTSNAQVSPTTGTSDTFFEISFASSTVDADFEVTFQSNIPPAKQVSGGPSVYTWNVRGHVQKDQGEIIDAVQLQEIGDSFVELFEVSLPTGNVAYFFNGFDGLNLDNIYFPDEEGNMLIEYLSLPIRIEGLDAKSTGVAGRPTLTMANIPALARSFTNNADGTKDETTVSTILENEGIFTAQDLVGSKVCYRTTLLKHTFNVGDTPKRPIQFPYAVYYINRVSSEAGPLLSLELTSPLDMEGVNLPNRYIVGKYCPWKYQGFYESGSGGCTFPLDSRGTKFFDENDNSIDINSLSAWSSTTSYNIGDKILLSIGGSPNPISTGYFTTTVGTSGQPTYSGASAGDTTFKITYNGTWMAGDAVDVAEILAKIDGYFVSPASLGVGGVVTNLTMSPGMTDTSGTVLTYQYTITMSQPITGNLAVGTPIEFVKGYTATGHTKIFEAIRPSTNRHPESQRGFWKRLDACGKRVNSCKIRFQTNSAGTIDTYLPLPFGGFIGTKKFK